MFFDEDVIYEEVNDRWQIGVIYIPDNGYDQISYVNCISTFKGGNHVKYVESDILKRVEEQILKRKTKILKLKVRILKKILFFLSIQQLLIHLLHLKLKKN